MNMMPIIIGSFALIAVFLPAIISTPHPARTLLYAVLAELATLAPILFTSSPINTTLIQYAIAKYAMTVAGFLHILHIKSTLLFAPTKTYVSNVVMHHTLAITFDIIGRYATYAALFMHVEWKPIPHESKVTIDDLNTNDK